MKFQPLRVSIVRLRCRWTKSFMARGAKKAIPERRSLLEHLARESRCSTGYEEPMVEQLQAHDQLDLLYDMEQPLAAVLAKMEIAGDQGRTPDPPRYAEWKTEVVLGA